MQVSMKRGKKRKYFTKQNPRNKIQNDNYNKQQQQKQIFGFESHFFILPYSLGKWQLLSIRRQRRRRTEDYTIKVRDKQPFFVKGRLFSVYLSYCICVFFYICCGVCVSEDFTLRCFFKTALSRDLKHLKKQENSFQQTAYRLKQQKL